MPEYLKLTAKEAEAQEFNHNTMLYKVYAAKIECSDEDAGFIGHITGIKEVIGFHGETVKELRTAFE
jgi:predicted HicB family RNase H-like nuclease